MGYYSVEGNLITLGKKGEFDVVVQGVNCFCTQSSGLAPQMVKAFETNKFPLEYYQKRGDINKLGQIDYKAIKRTALAAGEKHGFYNRIILDEALYVVNAYTQYKYGKNHDDGVEAPIDYEALTLCLRKINITFTGMRVGLPLIGCGLAGGDWNRVEKIIIQEMRDCETTVVFYKK